jgi:hypothetical protein
MPRVLVVLAHRASPPPPAGVCPTPIAYREQEFRLTVCSRTNDRRAACRHEVTGERTAVCERRTVPDP